MSLLTRSLKLLLTDRYKNAATKFKHSALSQFSFLSFVGYSLPDQITALYHTNELRTLMRTNTFQTSYSYIHSLNRFLHKCSRAKVWTLYSCKALGNLTTLFLFMRERSVILQATRSLDFCLTTSCRSEGQDSGAIWWACVPTRTHLSRFVGRGLMYVLVYETSYCQHVIKCR
jgi:hypothetical protein